MANKTDFFGCVAKHNLERFHSECIVWAFNNSKEMLERFIKRAHPTNSNLNIEAAQAFSETSDIDILIYYKDDGQDFLIHVENKVKANEGKKNITESIKPKLDLETKLDLERNYLSQTEYYWLRDKTKIEKQVSERIAKEEESKEIDIKEWYYVYLVPALENTTDNSLNTWSESFNKPNPWLNLSYTDIINCMADVSDISTDNIEIFRKYEAHLNNEFTSSYKNIIDITKGNEHRVVIKNDNDTLSSKNLNLLLDEEVETTILDASGMQIHFLKLKDSLAKFCDDEIDKKHKFEVEFLTETGNNSSYLIQAYSVIKLENPNPDIFEKTDPIDFRIGFQFEQNKKGKGKFKFYFADLLYESNLIKNEKKTNPAAKTQHPTYNAIVKEILINIFTKDYLEENLLLWGDGSRTKSFCSFLLDYKFKNSDEIEQKFKYEIDHLISKIKVKSLEDHIQLLSDKNK